MKKVLLTLGVVCTMLAGTLGGALAKDSTPVASPIASPVASPAAKPAQGTTAYARGLNTPATYLSERGEPIAEISVVKIERGWDDYNSYSEPEAGMEYVAITYHIQVVGRANVTVDPYDLSLLDASGRNNTRAYVEAAKDSETEIMREPVMIASGDATDVTLVYSLVEDIDFGYVIWQPDTGVLVMIDISGEN